MLVSVFFDTKIKFMLLGKRTLYYYTYSYNVHLITVTLQIESCLNNRVGMQNLFVISE